MNLQLQKNLNPEQIKAVKSVEGPLLIIAGAGSGKTRTIIYRIAYMLEQNIPPSSILALTFTNKAAREMSQRVRDLTGNSITNLTVSTFHAFGAKLLRSFIPLLGYNHRFSIYDQADKISLIKEVAGELSIDPGTIDLRSAAALFSAVKTDRHGWDETSNGYRSLFDEYQSHLKAYNAVDFDDLIALPIQIFNEHTDVLEKKRKQYRYILVDEFQDTSRIQYRLLKLLGNESRNVCVVGDDDQSIYSWRGANYENLMLFEQDFPESREIKLEQNYRSTKTILTAANGIISNNLNRKTKELWTGTGDGEKIELSFQENDQEEAAYITERIKSLSIRNRLKYHQFGILVRTNSLTRTIEEALLTENIPYRVSGGTSFFQRKEVKDTIAYLRVLANPDDDVNFLRIINTPRRGLGKKTLLILRELADKKHCSLYSALSMVHYAEDTPVSEAIKKRVSDFLGVLNYYQEAVVSNNKLSETVESLVKTINYWGWLLQEYQHNDKIATYKYRNISLFVDMIRRWEQNPDILEKDLYSFLNRITLITRDDIDEDDQKGKVNVMTIHAAKGLEFDIVFLPGAEDGIIPHSKSIEEDESNIEEERRLFYVAVTRAKRHLYISSCKKRKYMNKVLECTPSPFLDEIPDMLLETETTSEPLTSSEANDYFAAIKARFQ